MQNTHWTRFTLKKSHNANFVVTVGMVAVVMKIENCLDANFVVTGSTIDYHDDSRRCCQGRQNQHREEFRFPVHLPTQWLPHEVGIGPTADVRL